jgi:sulfhydrogenase subunit beta (sulfur reductase)
MEILERKEIDTLFAALHKGGYSTVGPTVRNGVVIYDEIDNSADLPIGWTDTQDAGKYRAVKSKEQHLFGYTHSPHSWKQFLYPPKTQIFKAKRQGKGFDITQPSNGQSAESKKYAFIGVRSCELAAIKTQDKVFTGGPFVDPFYKKRRESAFIVAVNCGKAGHTCFCVSMETGPKATNGFDLALTEILSDGEHYFTVEVGSDKGAEIMKSVHHSAAKKDHEEQARKISQKVAQEVGRTLDTTKIKELLQENPEHPHWAEVAARCLTCANCTLVCPTCFCSTVIDVTDLSGAETERTKVWDSCFTMDFAKVVGGNFRPSGRARYRQWLTHKFANWMDQFGTSGCVGCGRCITWCPAHIDVTEELRALREKTILESK